MPSTASKQQKEVKVEIVTTVERTKERANNKIEDAKELMEEEEVEDEQKKEEGTEEENDQRKKQQKSLDALYAAAREEFDLDLTPTESAIKTLREGREIQKLSVIRNLAELIEAEPKEAMQKVLPIIQELLNVEPSNLDMHCEGAVVYKNSIKDTKLLKICPELPERLLSAILENIEQQKENVAAAAWLESLVDIAEFVPQQSVTKMIVPLTIAQADSAKRVQRRVISTRLIEKLASLIPREILQRELCPCAQMLCQDPNSAVRISIAQRLSVLAQALNNSTDCCTLLLPCIIELCKDDDAGVREAILGALAICLPFFSKDAKKTVLLPLLRKCSEQALILRDASLPVVARHFGSWLQCLRDILAQSDLRWWLDTYTRIMDFANNQEEKNQANGAGTTEKGPTNPQFGTSCRRMCAYNFPCIVSIFGDDQEVFNQKLMPMLESFCRDPDDEVRSIIASGFHEILACRMNGTTAGTMANSNSSSQQPITTTATKTTATSPTAVPNNGTSATTTTATAHYQHPQLLNPFVELLSSGSSEVVQQLTGNLQKILPVLYREINAAATTSGKRRNTTSILAKLNQILISCNALLRGSGSWRAHEAYLNSIAILRQLVRPKDIKTSFVPLLKQEVLTARALPCRVAAAQSLLLMMRQLPMAKDRQTIIDFFITDIGQHQSCYRRRLLLDIVPLLLHHFTREFFIEKFLSAILKLSMDPISNIRLQLCRTLPTIKKFLTFPSNDKSLSNMERVVHDLLTSEPNALSKQIIQQAASELSRIESDPKECRMNKVKLLEEKRLWSEKDDKEEEKEEEKRVNKLKAEEARKHAEKQRDIAGGVPGSPESGIFFEEETKPAQGGGGGGLVRSATTANVSEVVHKTVPKLAASVSSETIAAMAIELPSSSSSSTSALASAGTTTHRRRPPVPTSTPPTITTTTSSPSAWRTNRNVFAAPKLAIVRPQPQVTITQRACSPMPPTVAERKMAMETMGGGENTKQSAIGGTERAAATKSKLPLSTTRYRTFNPNSQVQQLASKFMAKATDGSQPVTDSLKLKRYKPTETSGGTATNASARKSSAPSTTSTADANERKQRQQQKQQQYHQHTTSSSSSVSSPTATISSMMTRSASSAFPLSHSFSSTSSSTPSSPNGGVFPLQSSASSSSLGGGSSRTSSRRPYGLMKVQSTSSAVERKPAQIRCQVISMN